MAGRLRFPNTDSLPRTGVDGHGNVDGVLGIGNLTQAGERRVVLPDMAALVRKIAMKRFGVPLNVALVGATSIMILSACGPREDVAASASSAKPQASQAAVRNEKLLAAAEPFEALTEQAFTAPMPELTKLLAEGRAKAAVASVALDGPAAAQLRDLSSDLNAAFGGGDRSAVALASVESYRVLVSAQDAATAKAPIAVSLLDYAGFKYAGHLKARPPKWDEMATDVAFAKTTWAGLSGQVTSAGLKGAFETALSGMEDGVAQRNRSLAEHSAQTELALVDLLEEHLARR